MNGNVHPNDLQIEAIGDRRREGIATKVEREAALSALDIFSLPLILSVANNLWPDHHDATNVLRRALHDERARYFKFPETPNGDTDV